MNWKKIHIEETDSTNRYLWESHGEEDMVVVVADYQTAGRGQGTNSWESERGKNLLFSILVKPTMMTPANQFVLSMAEALALKSVLDGYTDDITLKWPNDIYWKDKKIGGTLIETAVADHCLKKCVFGTGINVNQEVFRSDAPNPVSLRQILGRETPVDEILQQVLEAFEREYQKVLSGDYDDISTRYQQALYRRTGYHTYRDENGLFEAAMIGVRPTGQLLLRDREGKAREYMFKEVTFMRVDE